MKLYRLDGKQVLSVKNQAAEFLKAYTTHVLESPKNAFVDIRGNIVAVFDQHRIAEDEVLIVMERQFKDRLLKHLDPYLKLGSTTIEEKPYRVYFDLDPQKTPVLEGEIRIPQKAGEIFLTGRELPSAVSDQEFLLFRVKNRMPVQGVDYDREMLLNLNDPGFVSYTKGCYLGQEIIARVHSRSRPPKKLVVKAQSDCGPDEARRMTSKVPDPLTGQTLGFIFIENTD